MQVCHLLSWFFFSYVFVVCAHIALRTAVLPKQNCPVNKYCSIMALLCSQPANWEKFCFFSYVRTLLCRQLWKGWGLLSFIYSLVIILLMSSSSQSHCEQGDQTALAALLCLQSTALVFLTRISSSPWILSSKQGMQNWVGEISMYVFL